ncbi:MAG: hypothetical protein ACRCW7_11115 [Cetobacterium sp.]
MLATTGVILTKAGALMISRALELIKPIEFTHMKIGTGDINSLSEARELNDLVSTHSTINMSTIVRSGDLVRVRGSFTNAEFISEQTIKEIGVFAKIGTEQPLLFGYVNDGQGEIIPPGNSGNVVSRVRDLYLGITGEAQVAIAVDKSLVYATIEDLEEGLNKKEDKFDKNSGFNKSKSDSTNLEDSNTLATSKAVSTAMKKATEAYDSAGGKEAAFNKNTAFNKNFGVSSGEVLEGAKLAEILGVTYGGILNNSNAKTAGIAYYCTTNKKIYKCTANTSLNYADASYFMELSNNDLLGKLNNLSNKTTYNNSFEYAVAGYLRASFTIKIEKVNKICCMSLFVTPIDSPGGESFKVENLPVVLPLDFRPTKNEYSIVRASTATVSQASFSLAADGTIAFEFRKDFPVGYSRAGSITYTTD